MREATKLILKIREDEEASYRQVISYLIGGGLYFWTGYLAFYLLYHNLRWTLFFAKVLADIVGWIFNYLINRYWVFKHHSLKSKALRVTTKYIIITVVDFLIDYIIVRLLKSIGISPYIGQFVSAAFFTVWNYYWYKLWVFKVTNKKSKPRIIK
jgi:putative flippase GtrA